MAYRNGGVVTFLALLSVLAVPGQEPVFRSGVSLVRVDAQVTEDGSAIDGLRREDFVVQDNGRPQSIRYFSQEEQPLDLLLLFDISNSMLPAIRQLAASATAGLAELRPGDRVAVWDFDTESRPVLPFTNSVDRASQAVTQIAGAEEGGGTFLLSSVYDAAGQFPSPAEWGRRRAILMLTDDNGQESMSEKRVLERLWSLDIVLCGLIVRTSDSRSGPHPHRESMMLVGFRSGGETVRSNDPGRTFREMVRRIRKRYSLYYAMPPVAPGVAREVTVDLTEEARRRHPEALVLARKGYVP